MKECDTTDARKRSLFDLTFEELQCEMAPLADVHAAKLWSVLHRKCEAELVDRADFLPPLRRWVDENLGAEGRFSIRPPKLAAETVSSDGMTRKYLLQLADGQEIESVLMGYAGRFTGCVSTQAGCAMGCVFCATGQMGFARHLAPGEIVTQVLHLRRALGASSGARLRNLVLMGMGEPLHNYDAVMTALEIISDTRAINIGPSRITISTVGVVPGILRMAEERRPYHLAVSLHGATESDRAALVPVSRRWPLTELMNACREYCAATDRRIFFEWTLIAGANDSPEHAKQLAELLNGMDAHVNLIPLNPTIRFAGTSAPDSAAALFSARCVKRGFRARSDSAAASMSQRGAASFGRRKAAGAPRLPPNAIASWKLAPQRRDHAAFSYRLSLAGCVCARARRSSEACC